MNKNPHPDLYGGHIRKIRRILERKGSPFPIRIGWRMSQ
jgi:hypothetical protein